MGLIYLSKWFISLKFEHKKTMGLKLLQVLTDLATVLLVEGKVYKFGLTLKVEKAKVATHIWRGTFLKNCKKNIISVNYMLCKIT